MEKVILLKKEEKVNFWSGEVETGLKVFES
jgi:hypothetical protein